MVRLEYGQPRVVLALPLAGGAGATAGCMASTEVVTATKVLMETVPISTGREVLRRVLSESGTETTQKARAEGGGPSGLDPAEDNDSAVENILLSSSAPFPMVILGQGHATPLAPKQLRSFELGRHPC